jgi:hypothetical protein
LGVAIGDLLQVCLRHLPERWWLSSDQLEEEEEQQQPPAMNLATTIVDTFTLGRLPRQQVATAATSRHRRRYLCSWEDRNYNGDITEIFTGDEIDDRKQRDHECGNSSRLKGRCRGEAVGGMTSSSGVIGCGTCSDQMSKTEKIKDEKDSSWRLFRLQGHGHLRFFGF